MKILLLGFKKKGGENEYETKRLISELKKRGHEVTFVLWSGITFSFTKKDGVEIRQINGRDFKYFDYIIPRSPVALGKQKSKHAPTGVYLSHLYRHYLLIVDYINQYHKHVLNEKVARSMPFYDKLFQHYLLAKNELPVLTSLLYTGRQLPDSVYRRFKTPYIVKSIEGSRGKQVFLINDTSEIPQLIEQFGLGKLMVQRFIPIKEDLRIIVIGNKVIGGMRRIAAEGEFRTNFSMGGFTEGLTVSPRIQDLAIRAAKVFNAEFAGVDIVEHKGEHYILEVNVFTGFEGFEDATRINVAEKLAAYIERKYLWSIEPKLKTTEKKSLFDALYAIEKQNFEESLSPRAFREAVAKQDIMIVKKEGKPIAYLMHDSKKNVRGVSRLVVSHKYIGQRIGRRMLKELVRIARSEGDASIEATVPKAYLRRQQSFKRAGFKQIRIEPGLFGRKGDGVIFEYKLTPTKRVGLTM
ncbi:MAG: GNAT family N-acetyltransferase, partial [Candidatus Spechtbacterales bacterium]